jgi:fructose-1,6-bisphosphatase
MKKLSMLILFSCIALAGFSKEKTLTITGDKAAGSGSQSTDPSNCSTTTKLKCTESSNTCYKITYDDSKLLCVAETGGGTLIPDGDYCDPFPVTIDPMDGSSNIFIPNVYIYHEYNEQGPTGPIYRVYEFTNDDCYVN